MKYRPMLFSGPMVRGLLDGSKTQTRRVFKLPRGHSWCTELGGLEMGHIEAERWPGDWHVSEFRCLYGQPGDRLWVRETCRAEELPDGLDGMRYLADNGFASIQPNEEGINRWLEMRDYGKRPSPVARVKTVPAIHMPRWASRITLEITGVRVERLQNISEADARAEGIAYDPGEGGVFYVPGTAGCSNDSAVGSYRQLWESINGPESWEANPWVWVLEFTRVEGGAA